jgi:asparagine synthase (glutamine-hydrolysing)
MARRHVTVALSGDGGDELFAGYTRYLVDRRRRWVDSLPLALRGPVFRTLTRALPAGTYGVNLLRTLAHDRTNRYLDHISALLDPRVGGIASAELFDGIRWVDVAQPFLEAFARVRHRDFSTQLMYVDLQTYLPDDILTKVDRMSMMHSLEVRPPFLDHPLVEFAVSLPSSFKIDGGRTKKVLREAAGDMLPAVIGNRGKQGFAMPLAPWFKVDLRCELERLARWEGPLSWSVDRDARRRLVTEHLRGRRDHSHILWRMLFLMGWEAWGHDPVKAPPRTPPIPYEARLQ